MRWFSLGFHLLLVCWVSQGKLRMSLSQVLRDLGDTCCDFRVYLKDVIILNISMICLFSLNMLSPKPWCFSSLCQFWHPWNPFGDQALDRNTPRGALGGKSNFLFVLNGFGIRLGSHTLDMCLHFTYENGSGLGNQFLKRVFKNMSPSLGSSYVLKHSKCGGFH